MQRLVVTCRLSTTCHVAGGPMSTRHLSTKISFYGNYDLNLENYFNLFAGNKLFNVTCIKRKAKLFYSQNYVSAHVIELSWDSWWNMLKSCLHSNCSKFTKFGNFHLNLVFLLDTTLTFVVWRVICHKFWKYRIKVVQMCFSCSKQVKARCCEPAAACSAKITWLWSCPASTLYSKFKTSGISL